MATGLAGCKKSLAAKPSAPAAAVSVANVVVRNIRASNEFNGRIMATNYVVVRPRVTGYVDRVVYREGDAVRRGDLLFVIDPRPYQAAPSFS